VPLPFRESEAGHPHKTPDANAYSVHLVRALLQIATKAELKHASHWAANVGIEPKTPGLQYTVLSSILGQDALLHAQSARER